MSAASGWKFAFLAYFSRPKGERALYRHLRRAKPKRIVELGVGSARRSLRMLSVAERYVAGTSLQYTGIDLFESRPADQPSLALKEAHRLLKQSAARVRLFPGDPLSALSAVANTLLETDLLLIAADQDSVALEAAWFFVPRMLHARTTVLREELTEDGESHWKPVAHAEIHAAAQNCSRQRRRAA